LDSAMVHRDFYLRMIAELGRNLRLAVERYRAGQLPDSRAETDELFANFYDMRAEVARDLPEEVLLRLLAAEPDRREQWQFLADLLLLDGDLLAAQHQPTEALKAWRQSLRIYRWLQAQVDTVFSFDRRQRIQELARRIEDWA